MAQAVKPHTAAFGATEEAEHLRVVGQGLGQDVSPCHTAQATNGEASGKVVPALGGLQGIPGHGAARQSLHTQRGLRLELGRSIDGQAQGQDQHQASTGHAASNLSNTLDVAQGAQLDEWAGQQKAMGQTNLHTTQQGSNTSAVSGQVGQVVGNNGGGGDGGLQHAHEGITVHRLDDLGLVVSSAHTDHAPGDGSAEHRPGGLAQAQGGLGGNGEGHFAGYKLQW
mmetsp:Transcript_18440/g.39630  ORF Transcript_18440/g.39630 Transcript_18440/m.39630 type:complete len:225 (-) Transcript_18440:51-725(-)